MVSQESEQRSPQGEYEHANLSAHSESDDIDLLALWNTVWEGRWIVSGITTLVAVSAVVISLMLPNIYRSEVLLAPANPEEFNVAGSLAGQFGGIAGLAGINLGGASVSKTALALEILKSRAFIIEFIRRHKLEVPLIAATGWNQPESTWIIDPRIYSVAEKKWVRKVSCPLQREPSDLELYEAFRNGVLVVRPDAKSGLVTVGIELMSPEMARQWLTFLIEDINNYIRRNDIEDSEKSIAYLNVQLSKTSVSEMQNIFYQLIEQQTKRMMLAQVRDEYAFKVIDPPIVPEYKSEPKRAQICILATLLGGIVGLIFVFVRKAVAERPIVESG